MKALSLFATLSLLISSSAFAEITKGLLKDIRQLTESCVVQPYHYTSKGDKVLDELRSVCSELVVTPQGATIWIHGETLHAFLIESEDSDEGDLDHLLIVNGKGDVVAQRKNVAAFDLILLALAGGNHEFPEVQE